MGSGDMTANSGLINSKLEARVSVYKVITFSVYSNRAEEPGSFSSSSLGI
jgi:hypothetical protein